MGTNVFFVALSLNDRAVLAHIDWNIRDTSKAKIEVFSSFVRFSPFGCFRLVVSMFWLLYSSMHEIILSS